MLFSKNLNDEEVLHEVQFLKFIEQVRHRVSHAAHSPLFTTRGGGQIVTQVLLYFAASIAQSTQFVVFIEQVAHSEEQLSHVRKVGLVIVYKLGQLPIH